jgi:hypothetical protein
MGAPAKATPWRERGRRRRAGAAPLLGPPRLDGRRFRDHQDMILRFATDLAIGFTISKLDAFRQLFTTGPWLPPATTPP